MTDLTDPAVMAYKLEQLEDHIDLLQLHIDRLENEERSRLKAGITVLGAILLSLLGVIWQFRQYIVGGSQ